MALDRELKVGDMVLATIQVFVHGDETVYGTIEAIDGRMAYLDGDDGEPYCTLLEYCDKIPL